MGTETIKEDEVYKDDGQNFMLVLADGDLKILIEDHANINVMLCDSSGYELRLDLPDDDTGYQLVKRSPW
jgi:hypothetical protein